MTYNGENQGVFNSNGTYFYTHELMESYIGWSMCGQITHSGFFRTHIDGILKTMDLHALEGDSIWRALLARPSAVERFVRAMFDFITLQKIDYRDLYRCRCAFQESLQSQIARATPDHGHERTHSGSDDVPGRPSAAPEPHVDALPTLLPDGTHYSHFDSISPGASGDSSDPHVHRPEQIITDTRRVLAVYDNACKAKESGIKCFPRFLAHLTLQIDACHFCGHTNCSCLYSHKSDLHTRDLNAIASEQINVDLNRMISCVGKMGQFRALFYMLHRIALLNNRIILRIMQARRDGKDIRRLLKCISYTIDGVRIGFRLSLSRLIVPWMLGYESSLRDGGAVMAAEGALLASTLMVPSPEHRLCMLNLLGTGAEKKCVWGLLQWCENERPSLLPLINLNLCSLQVSCNVGGKVTIIEMQAFKRQRANHGCCLMVVQHWACGAPESLLVEPRAMACLDAVLRNGVVTADEQKWLSAVNPGLDRLLSTMLPSPRDESSKRPSDSTSVPVRAGATALPPELAAILHDSLRIARQCLVGRTSYESRAWPPHDSAWASMSDFQVYFRSGVWSPDHPPCRQMPVALIDSKNASSRARYSDQRERVLHAAIEALRHSEDSRGVTCNKNKVVKKYTTNGLFTFVCLGCGMLVMLHSIERQETPMTAMNLLCLHAHTLDDHKAHALYLAGGLWHDPLAVLDDSLSLPTVALGSADLYGEVVRTPA